MLMDRSFSSSRRPRVGSWRKIMNLIALARLIAFAVMLALSRLRR